MSLLSSVDALLITNPTNIRYLTGFAGVAPEEREAYCLVTQDKLFLFTNALYREEVIQLTRKPRGLKRLNLLASKGLTFIEISREEPFAKRLMEVVKRLNPAKQGLTLKKVRFGFEETDLTVAKYNKLKKELKAVTLVPTKNRIEELRMIKRDDEIANIKEAAKLTDQCFNVVLDKLKPGVTESEIAWEIEKFFRERGARLAFSPIVAFGSHSSQPHYSFSLKRSHLLRLKGETLKNQDLVLLDFGGRVNGYCADMTRVVFVGKPKDEWRQAYQTVFTAQQKALEYLNRHSRVGGNPDKKDTGSPIRACPRPNRVSGMTKPLSGSSADQLARDIIQKSGFPAYPHSLGHGVGLDIHEIPRLIARKDRILLPGMVVTIEPGVYIERQYGIRIEDLVLLKKDGIEILSKSSQDVIIL